MPDSPRAALLRKCIEYLQQTGFGQLSLREIATGAGTSHRMLIYHFGSREGLLAAIVGAIEAEQRIALNALGQTDLEPIEIARMFWRHVSDPSLAPAERLFFEVYVQALHGREWTDGFRTAVIDAWEGPLIDAFADIAAAARESASQPRGRTRSAPRSAADRRPSGSRRGR